MDDITHMVEDPLPADASGRYDPRQIIVAATRNAARVGNLDRELGTIEVGKIVDVWVVNGDPLQDLRALAQVRLVFHHGVVIRD